MFESANSFGDGKARRLPEELFPALDGAVLGLLFEALPRP